MQKSKVASKLMDLYCFNTTKYRWKTGEVSYRAIDRPYSASRTRPSNPPYFIPPSSLPKRTPLIPYTPRFK